MNYNETGIEKNIYLLDFIDKMELHFIFAFY